jgi:predicted DNA-binding transcriptional regulator AlpA
MRDNKMSEADIVRLLVSALKEVHLIPENKRLWTKAHIASYVNKSESVVDRMTILPHFPGAIRIPTETGRMHPQWKAIEVIAWVEKHQDKAKRKLN